MELAGRWALVGGASQGIGEASARALAAQGAKVILMSRRSDVLETIKATLPEPTSHRTLALDLERSEDVSTYLGRVIQDTGPISIWVNCTGGPKPGPLAEASSAEMEHAFRGHLIASQLILRTLLPGMKQLQYGRIINVLSSSVKTPLPNLGVSNLIRAAMASWAKTLAGELGPFGITINNVLPGLIETPRIESLASGVAAKSEKSVEEIRAAWTEAIPLRRIGHPSEIAATIAYLSSPQASYVTGVNLPVDGGRTPAL